MSSLLFNFTFDLGGTTHYWPHNRFISKDLLSDPCCVIKLCLLFWLGYSADMLVHDWFHDRWVSYHAPVALTASLRPTYVLLKNASCSCMLMPACLVQLVDTLKSNYLGLQDRLFWRLSRFGTLSHMVLNFQWNMLKQQSIQRKEICKSDKWYAHCMPRGICFLSLSFSWLA